MYLETLKAITQNNIRVSLLRDEFDKIEDKPELDILIEPANIDLVISLLNKQGWIFYRFGKINSYKYVAAKVINNRKYLLDIHTALVQDNIVYMETDKFFTGCIEISDNLFTPSATTYYFHLLCHIILGKKQLPSKYVDILDALISNSALTEELRIYINDLGYERIFKRVLANPIETLKQPIEVKKLKEEFITSLSSLNKQYLLRKIKRIIYKHLAPFFGKSRGMTIAFIGPDGAGKSTFIDELKERLRELDISTTNAYLGPWFRHKFFTTLLLESIGANPADEIYGLNKVTSPTKYKIKKFKGLVRRYLYYFNAPIEVYYRYFRYVYLQSLKGNVVLIDRYIHDLEVGFMNKEVKNNNWLRRAIVRLSPKPDLMILLYNDPETIWNRKKEYTLDKIQWAMDKYLDLTTRYEIEKVKTIESSDVLVDKFINENWKKIYQIKSEK